MLYIIIILLLGRLLYKIHNYLKKKQKRYKIKVNKKPNFKNNIIIAEEAIHNLCKEYICSLFEDDQLLISYNEEFNRYKKINKLISSYPNANKYFLYILIDGLQFDEKCYFINTEQLTRDKCLNYIKELKRLHPKLKLLDYSYQNVKILNQIGIQSTYLPYQKYKLEIFNFEKIYDVAIIGLNLKKKKKKKIDMNIEIIFIIY
mgnify:CR=1 FL=1